MGVTPANRPHSTRQEREEQAEDAVRAIVMTLAEWAFRYTEVHHVIRFLELARNEGAVEGHLVSRATQAFYDDGSVVDVRIEMNSVILVDDTGADKYRFSPEGVPRRDRL